MPIHDDDDRVDGGEPVTDEDAHPQIGGSDVKQGLHGQSTRMAARGRDEFVGRGDASRHDEGRATQAGRHYGRSGEEEPGPGYGRGPLQPGGSHEAEGAREAAARQHEQEQKKATHASSHSGSGKQPSPKTKSRR